MVSSERVGVMKSRVDRLDGHLTERINNLGGLDGEYMRAQLSAIKADIVKLANKAAVMTPPHATDALMQLFTTPQGTSRLDKF